MLWFRIFFSGTGTDTGTWFRILKNMEPDPEPDPEPEPEPYSEPVPEPDTEPDALQKLNSHLCYTNCDKSPSH